MNVIERFTNPSRHVQEPYSTLWINGESCFIQVSKDPENPNWLSIGDFLGVVFKGSIHNEDFISKCLTKYENPSLDFEGDSL